MLPPTWTPLPTDTPFPTATITPTETPTGTPSISDLCGAFNLLAMPAKDAQLDFDARISFAWHATPSDTVPVVITVINHDQPDNAKDQFHGELPQSGDMILGLPLIRLADAGHYDWKIALRDPQYGEICVHSGSFVRKPIALM